VSALCTFTRSWSLTYVCTFLLNVLFRRDDVLCGPELEDTIEYNAIVFTNHYIFTIAALV
jgi:hypothetical protein